MKKLFVFILEVIGIVMVIKLPNYLVIKILNMFLEEVEEDLLILAFN